MKRFLAILISLVLVLSAGYALAEYALEKKEASVVLNGDKTLEFVDQDGQKLDCVLLDGQMYVPFEALIAQLGGTYSYSEDSGVIDITLPLTAPEGETDTVAASTEKVELPSPVGSWSCDFANATATLDISEDGTAYLVVGQPNFNCTWEVDGDVFTLIQNGISFDGSYDGTTIIIQFGPYNLELTRS